MRAFIKARQNKDNFWNIMFWLMITAGTAFIGLLPTALIIPFIVRKFNKVTFTKDKNFLNRNGDNVDKRRPLGVWIAAFTIASCLITGALMDSYWHKETTTLGALLFFSGVFSGPVLYFILINCPISILFNLNTYRVDHPAGKYIHRPSKSSFDNRSRVTDPNYRYMSCNVYNSSR